MTARKSILSFIAKGLIRVYQRTISPLLGSSCRFWPSCSHYALEAFETHSFGQALKLTLKRILRCGSGMSKKFPHGGIDKVPPPSEEP